MTRKHEANIKKSKWINIQLGIIAFLSFTFFMYEVQMYTEPNIAEVTYTVPTDDNVDVAIGKVIAVPNVPEIKTIKSKPITKTISEKIPTKIDNTITETKIVEKLPEESKNKQPKKTDGTERKALSKSTTVKNKGKTENKINNIYTARTVDFLPVFPGCDKYSTNDERALCFQKKIQRLITKKFNNGLGEELGLSGKQRIMLYFEIDKNGNVTNIKANSLGKIKGLENEARRVARLLPKMEPARAGKRRVKMSYTLPISFEVR